MKEGIGNSPCLAGRSQDDRLPPAETSALALKARSRTHEQGTPRETNVTRAIMRKPGEGRTIAVVGDVYRFLATGEDTDGRYALWEAFVSPGGGPPPHVHSREEEGFYVLEGEITFLVGDKRLVAGPGMFANMPVGTPHTFKNESGQPARMLISVAPAGLEKMFFEVGQPVREGAQTAPPPTKEEIQKLLAVAPRYGIEIKLPPSSTTPPSPARE
jgi:mannose-6-phosphate isomerase-like protein (cupin superfamily)